MLSTNMTEKVVIAVRAEKKEISKTALAWALTHIVRPGDCITLLAVLYDEKKPGRKLWKNFARFNGDCGSSHRERGSSTEKKIYQISESFSQMVLQFNDQNQVGVRIKVVSGSTAGVVAVESKKAGATWVVLDKQLKEEEKQCMEELHCNIVIMKHSQAKVLRVNLGSSIEPQPFSSSPSTWELNSESSSLDGRIKHSTPVSSPENSKLVAQDSFVCEQNPLFERHKKQNSGKGNNTCHVFNSDIRDAVSLTKASSAPPPLCSLCQLKSPVFGKPLRRFEYRELELATDRFLNGLGSVHRGVLSDGQVIVVKWLNTPAFSTEAEFCREVGVLSSARHRNIITMIGFCIHGKKRLLVYEYVCNNSLDFHLYGNGNALDWSSRVKIAIETARGLRYLHEDCRVGCIAHRDLRPNNILLTHDFEPLIGNFGIAKLGPQTELCKLYLAPEYTHVQDVTEKVDVYAFGMVLNELITGKKTTLDQINHELVDPHLDLGELRNCSDQLRAMARAASLCLQRDPELRPPMSKVLRILEGENDVARLTFNYDSVGNRSARMSGLSSNRRTIANGRHSRTLSQ